jgi:hypothetical protein
MTQRRNVRTRATVKFVSGVLSSAIVLASSIVCAGDKPIALGEVSSEVTRASVDVTSVLRDAITHELSTLDVGSLQGVPLSIISVSVLRLDHDGKSGDDTSTCVVSAALRDARKGSVFAVLEGRARAMGDAKPADNELRAIYGAVHGAVLRVHEALASRKK